MARRLAVLAALTPPLLFSAPVSAAPRAVGADAMWVWSWPSKRQLVHQVRDEGLSVVYLYCEGGFGAKVRRTVSALTADGVAVEALGGEPRWGRASGHEGLKSFIDAVLDYQTLAPPEARLAGIPLDVEPYGLPGWDDHPDEIMASYLDSLEFATDAAGDLPVAADIPFWLDSLGAPGGGSVLKAALDRLDAATIMSYRDRAADVLDVASEEIAAGQAAGVPVTLGLETLDVRPGTLTFHQEGRGALRAAISKLHGADGVAGVAVHDSASLRRLH